MDGKQTPNHQKRGGVELEKNRFVLEHKIDDLRRQIEPKDEAIAELRAQGTNSIEKCWL